MTETTPHGRLSIEQVARICHEANRAFCEALGDYSQDPWDSAAPWQRDSAVAGVRLHLDDPSLTPGESHRAWYDHKAADGWTWGPEKDPDTKRHPCMVPFEDLPLEQQRKDYLFTNIVEALRPLVDAD